MQDQVATPRAVVGPGVIAPEVDPPALLAVQGRRSHQFPELQHVLELPALGVVKFTVQHVV